MTEAFLPQEIIRRKRDGDALSADEIGFMVRGLTDGTLSEGQIAAFAMAIVLRGMTAAETVALTEGMTHSGTVLDWSRCGISDPLLDKHSSGGIGDKVSLILAPMVAACGGAVPMISGRGLGHTGGTLDKLEAIPGYDAAPSLARFRQTVREAGCAIIGQTDDLAPADRRLYAVRDVTATVESIPLITASILSKKLAAGLDGLVMDVKVGTGAFMAALDDATALARSIVAVANRAGLPCTALVTDMNQALGRAAGNAVEIREAIDHLTGAARDRRLGAVTDALAAELLIMGGLADSDEDAKARLCKAIATGAAAERFARMVRALGGPSDLVEAPERHLPQAAVGRPIPPLSAGAVQAIDARALGLAIVELGGGRRQAPDAVDPAVGLTEIAAIGEAVSAERPLCLAHAASEDDAAYIVERVQAAFAVGAKDAPDLPVVHERIAMDAT